MRNFHASVNKADLVKSFNLWGETTVNAENLALDDCPNTKIIKDLGAIFPWVSVSVLPYSLIIETINGGDLSSLVISSEKSDVSRVLKLEA